MEIRQTWSIIVKAYASMVVKKYAKYLNVFVSIWLPLLTLIEGKVCEFSWREGMEHICESQMMT